MKILVGILAIVLAVFLNYVELGTPLGTGFSFGRGAAPRPFSVAVPSGSRQTGRGERGGRHGRQQSGRTPQPVALPKVVPETPPGAPPAAAPAAPPAAVPEASPSTDSINCDIQASQVENIPRAIYIEHPLRGFIQCHKKTDVILFEYNCVVIGRLADEQILPIFNKRHEIIRIDYNKNGLRTTMNRTEARRWGVFDTYAHIRRVTPPAFL